MIDLDIKQFQELVDRIRAEERQRCIAAVLECADSDDAFISWRVAQSIVATLRKLK